MIKSHGVVFSDKTEKFHKNKVERKTVIKSLSLVLQFSLLYKMTPMKYIYFNRQQL